MANKYVVVLAAGQGTRMKSKLYKVLHEVAGKSMVDHVVSQVEKLNPNKIVTVVGHGAQAVEKKLGKRVTFVKQEEQLGTGHAVLQTKSILGDLSGSTLVINGDTPLLTAETLANLFTTHEASGAKATVLTAKAPNPTGYGRVVRDAEGNVQRIVEQKDANEQEKAIDEINTGVFCFDNQALFSALSEVKNDNAQHEYYLTDVMEILRNENEKIAAYQMADFTESMGVNDRVALAAANKAMYRRINQQQMINGVTIIDPENTYIDTDVKIGQDTIIEPNVVIKGHSVIGNNCHINSASRIVDSIVDDDVVVTSSTLESSHMHQGSDIGPNSHLRPDSEILEGAHIGNFVEIKRATIGKHSKVGHLTYVGDATIGAGVNIGCGVVFVNYDGVRKFHSNVGDKAFIGSNSNILAPVDIADHAFIAAGSTINHDVPNKAMAIARARQTNKADYWDKLPLSKDKDWE